MEGQGYLQIMCPKRGCFVSKHIAKQGENHDHFCCLAPQWEEPGEQLPEWGHAWENTSTGLAAQRSFHVGQEVCTAGTAALVIALTSSSSQIFRSQAYKHCLFILPELCIHTYI